jgi:hypothetical protein
LPGIPKGSLEIGILKAVIFGGLTMMSKEEIEAEAKEWLLSHGSTTKIF